MPSGTKGRKRGKSQVLRRGEALSRAKRAGLRIVNGRAVVSKSGTINLTVGGSRVKIGTRLATSLKTAALSPTHSRSSLYVSVSAPPPARIVRLSAADISRIRAAARLSV